jgi:uncharacterized protein YbjT (DUF2867 family)
VKIFFSGASCAIGRRAVPQLLVLGHDVTAMARSPASAREGSNNTAMAGAERRDHARLS